MSFEHQDNELIMGDVLPAPEGLSGTASHLYISLSELIADCIFYHPGIENFITQLNESEQQALNTILAGKTVGEHFVSVLVEKIELAVQATSYKTVRICLSDADSYEYRSLLGGQIESDEINPAMGMRGVSRLVSGTYSRVFELQCDLIKQLRLRGICAEIVVPFVRTLSDAASIIDKLAEQGLPRGLNGLKVLFSCDVPSTVLLAERLLQYFDGALIHVEHLTQFTLGVDKYNESLSYLYKPENDAVVMLIEMAASAARRAQKTVGVVVRDLDLHSKFTSYLQEHLQAEVVYCF
jgi:pyruvate,water dikinase